MKHPVHEMLNAEQVAAVEKLRRELDAVINAFIEARPSLSREGGKVISDAMTISVLASSILLGIQTQVAVSSGVDPRVCAVLTQLGVTEGNMRVRRASLEVAADVELAERMRREGKMN